jgi:hypothetical protein
MKNNAPKSEKEKLISIIRLVAIAAVSLSILGVAAFIIWQASFERVLGKELFKISFEFLLLIVIGGAVSFLFSVYIKLREEIKQEDESAETKKNEKKALQRKFHFDFIQTYNGVKNIRRLLRARARIMPEDHDHIPMILIKRYDKHLQKLIRLQLQFEFFTEVIESNKDLFIVDDYKTFVSSLHDVEKYLNNIVSEYEDCYMAFPGQALGDGRQILRVDELDTLNDFIGRTYDSPKFEKDFKAPAKYVIASMKRLLTSS